MRKLAFYGFLLILAYLALVHWGGLAQIESHGATGTMGIIKAFQGR